MPVSHTSQLSRITSASPPNYLCIDSSAPISPGPKKYWPASATAENRTVMLHSSFHPFIHSLISLEAYVPVNKYIDFRNTLLAVVCPQNENNKNLSYGWSKLLNMMSESMFMAPETSNLFNTKTSGRQGRRDRSCYWSVITLRFSFSIRPLTFWQKGTRTSTRKPAHEIIRIKLLCPWIGSKYIKLLLWSVQTSSGRY